MSTLKVILCIKVLQTTGNALACAVPSLTSRSKLYVMNLMSLFKLRKAILKSRCPVCLILSYWRKMKTVTMRYCWLTSGPVEVDMSPMWPTWKMTSVAQIPLKKCGQIMWCFQRSVTYISVHILSGFCSTCWAWNGPKLWPRSTSILLHRVLAKEVTKTLVHIPLKYCCYILVVFSY